MVVSEAEFCEQSVYSDSVSMPTSESSKEYDVSGSSLQPSETLVEATNVDPLALEPVLLLAAIDGDVESERPRPWTPLGKLASSLFDDIVHKRIGKRYVVVAPSVYVAVKLKAHVWSTHTIHKVVRFNC